MTSSKRIAEKAGGSEELNATYQTHVVYPLEELMLNREHVEAKLLAATGTEDMLEWNHESLIGKEDWPNLATLLAKDRDLAVKLFEGPAFELDALNDNNRRKVLRGIDGLEKKYAIDTFAKQPSRKMILSCDQSNLPSQDAPAPINVSVEDLQPASGCAWKMTGFAKETLGLKRRTYHSSSTTSADDTTPLMVQ